MRRIGIELLHLSVRISLVGALAGLIAVVIFRHDETGLRQGSWIILAACAVVTVTAGNAADRLEGKAKSTNVADGEEDGQEDAGQGVYLPEGTQNLVALSVAALEDPERFEKRWGALPNGLLLEGRNKRAVYEIAEYIAQKANVRPAVIVDPSVASFNLGSFYERARLRGNRVVIIKDAGVFREPLDGRGRALLEALTSEIDTSMNEGRFVLTVVCLPLHSDAAGAGCEGYATLKQRFPLAGKLTPATKEERLEMFDRDLRRKVGKKLRVSVVRLAQLSDGLDHKEIRDLCRTLCLRVAAGTLQEVELKDFQKEIERLSGVDATPSA